MNDNLIKIAKFLSNFIPHRGKKYLSCHWLEHGMIFDHCNVIRVCCAQNHEGKGRYMLKSGFQGLPIDWKAIFDEKRKQRDIQRNGGIFESCKGCIELEYKYWDNQDYISKLLFTHWIHCNSACTYCPAIKDEVLKHENIHYDVVPAVKDLIEKKILKKNAKISIAGGEATIYPEFENLLNTLLDYGIKDILINTSGIKYSKAIEKGIKKGAVTLLVSLDAGTKKTHNQIKTVDSFDEVIDNLKKYAASQSKNKKLVSTKYIIIPGVNDNEKELYLWLLTNKELKINAVALDIEIDWFHQNNKSIPDYIFELVEFAQKKAINLNLEMKLFDRAFMIHKIADKKRNSLNKGETNDNIESKDSKNKNV